MHFRGDENGSKRYILPGGLEMRGIIQSQAHKTYMILKILSRKEEMEAMI